MLFKAKIKCPQCQGARCRNSRWLSVEEKIKHPYESPHRCLECGHRFLSHQGPATGQGRAVPVSIAVLVMVIAVVFTYALTRPPSPADVEREEATLALLDPGVKTAAEAGDAGAQYRLGEALLQQPGHTPENSAQAIRWLQMAAENGNTEAMIALGRLSRTGVGILQNFGQAAKWLQTAAARGNPEGMLELGRLYRDGVGVQKDPVRAYVWFNRASAARNLDAVHERDLIARMLTPEEWNEAQNQSSAPDAGETMPGVKEKPLEASEKTPEVKETALEGKEPEPDTKGKPPAAKRKTTTAKDKT